MRFVERGNSFVLMWKLQDGTMMRDLATEAIQTACIIQKHFGRYETDVGVTLRVKLAIASGKIYFTSIGDPQRISHYIITGQPVWDVKFAEGLCKGGDIIVAASSWQLADRNEYVFKTLPDGVHTLILSCNIMWDQTKGTYADSEMAINTDTNSEKLFPKLSVLEHIGPDTLRTRKTHTELKTFSSPFNTDYSLRPKVIKVAKQRLKKELQSYILRPVVRSVKMDEPLEYLTEIRQVVIVFINIVTANIGPRKLILLVNAVYKTPFSFVHLIFSDPLQFNISTTSQTRENTLLFHLKSLRYPEFLCALNPVFNVKYRVSSYYLNLSVSEKRTILEKLIFKLVVSCFNQPWVVITDDTHNADEQSLSLLATIIEHHHIFFVFSFGKMEITDRKHQISKILEKAKIIDLMGLDKWFHAALACQLLKVSAIPAELEKVIQEKSMGNPGWIESYLVSLLQIEGIRLKEIPKSSMKEMGLVAPPAIMLEQRKHSKVYNSLNDEPVEERSDGWKMYETSYGASCTRLDHEKREFQVHDEETSKTVQTLPENGHDDSRIMKNCKASSSNQPITEELIHVCLVPRVSLLEEVTPEVTMDVLILKRFDSLSPLEQYLLKCAAVLGEIVDRAMLQNLMVESSTYDVAVAVFNLFNMRILGCASGDSARSNAPIMFFTNIKSPNLGTEIKCGCPGVAGKKTFDGFPDYANCLLMRFKIAKFRETTYRLLTEYQKIELHKKALKYLQRNTRRCGPCGRGFFAKLMGKVHEDSVRDSKRMRNNLSEEFSDYSADGTDREDFEEEEMKRRSSLVLNPSAGLVVPKTFEGVDFRDCQCNLILVNAYTQILEHCRGIDRKDKTLTTILEFVEVLLAAYNVAYATKLLCDAEEILGKIFVDNEDELVKCPLLKAKIKTLQGKCHLQIGLVDEALKSFAEAVATLGYDFPKTTIMINVKSRILLGYQKIMLMYWGGYLIGVDEGDAADYNSQLAICLSQLFVVFRIKEMQDHARLAAIWSLNSALTSNNDFVTMCHAFANMIVIADNYQYQGLIPWLENGGIAFCNQREDALELEELKAIIELYTKVSFSRLLREERVQASQLGGIALRLAKTVKSVRQELMIFPRVIQSLMVDKKMEKIVSLMKELELVANSIVDQSGRLWYHAFCVDLQLECGVTIASFKKCEKFYQLEGDSDVHLNDPEAKKRFLTSMWLW
ncbi:adenylate cyclase type 10-like [Fopius arisanus]|uniref:Adenylate cyclase type 10-like n=1 Tax=Fopius arisanus TaxID=64838 RepID=A0A9R1TMJ2_9HYME|nr:PREDICTED: adenylate cyclase type 10-like [Fopius arisanus]